MVSIVLVSLVIVSCQKSNAVEVVNPCNDEIVVHLWETPTPGAAKNDLPARAVIPPLTKVEVKGALVDVGTDGSSAEIISGPGTGEIVFIPHGGDLMVIVPGELCGK